MPDIYREKFRNIERLINPLVWLQNLQPLKVQVLLVKVMK